MAVSVGSDVSFDGARKSLAAVRTQPEGQALPLRSPRRLTVVKFYSGGPKVRRQANLTVVNARWWVSGRVDA